MATLLYVASTETFVGKSAVCMGLLTRMRKDGFNIGYMKPVSVSVACTTQETHDEDTVLVKETLGLDTPINYMSPILVTSGVMENILNGKNTNYTEILMEAYRSVYTGKDVVLLEGTNRWVEGALVNLSTDQVISLLDAPVLLVCRYTSTLTVDNILTVQRYLGNRVVGVLINQIEQPHFTFVRSVVAPYLEQRGIQVLGMLPHDPFLASVTVGELLDHMGGQYIGSPEWRDNPVMSLMIGAMGVDASLSHFRRRANKAVVTGGDRPDIQLVALETSTSVLVLSGNMRPSLNVLNRAEERQVPIIIVPDDTLTAVERAEQLFGHVRFHKHAKMHYFSTLMDEHFDFQRLYNTVGIQQR